MKAILIALFLPLFITTAVFSAEVAPGKKQLPLPGESLVFDGHEAFVIPPEKPAPGSPWVWYAPTLRGLPSKAEVWMFNQFLAKGIAIAGVDVGESYGSPDGRKIFGDFHAYLSGERHFSKKPVLLARSRGGLMLYCWAAENPQSVAAIAGIYPVCNIASYPGIGRAAGAYHMTPEQLEAKLYEHNPIARLATLAKAGVPIRHIHGDKDKIVPLEANSAELMKNYKALGGEGTLEIVPGGGHDMNRNWFESQVLTDFIITNAIGEKPDPVAPATLVGRLEGGIMAIGGETTGWQLTYPGGRIEVDMNAIDKPEAFDGKNISVSGRVFTKNYVERGAVDIMIAEKVSLKP
jgi:hypothetical protein